MKDYLGYNNRYKLDDYLNHNGEHLQVNVIRWYKSYFVCNYCDMIGLPYITHVCKILFPILLLLQMIVFLVSNMIIISYE